jgi:hypothetical protein
MRPTNEHGHEVDALDFSFDPWISPLIVITGFTPESAFAFLENYQGEKIVIGF